MLNLVIATIVTGIVGYLIIKRYKSQAVLLVGGIVLMICSMVIVGKPLLDPKTATGLQFFDIFKHITNLFSSRAGGMGMTIMAVAGFTRYMDKIGASSALVKICIKPLKMFHAPYLVLALGYFVGQILNIFIPSASGLGLLLMLTMYPVIVSLGVSKAGTTAMIATASCLDLGPASGNAVLAARNANIDVTLYFTEYQIPVGIIVMFTIAIAHYFTQQYFDKKEGHVAEKSEMLATSDNMDNVPLVYALLPVLPLGLILIFSKLFIASIKMDVITAMIISVFTSMTFEYIRKREAKETLKSIQIFFDGMGTQFATVVTLIVAGETFAKGLTSIGAIDIVIQSAQNAGFGAVGMTIVMTGVIVVASIVMGSGNAPFFAFAALAPAVAQKMAVAPVLLLLPMQFSAGIARNMSPITAVVVAVCGISNVEPIDVVKRATIPMVAALIVTMVGTFGILH